jgi:hypothetical protein
MVPLANWLDVRVEDVCFRSDVSWDCILDPEELQ